MAFYKKKSLSEEHKRKIGQSIKNWHKKFGFSKATRKKLSNISKGHIVSEEARRKISEANKGKVAWNKGLTKSDPRVLRNIQKSSITRKKLWKDGKWKPWNFGKPWSEEVKSKISSKRKGKTYEEIMGKEKALKLKQRLSELGRMKVGRNNPMYGRKGEKNPHFGKPAEHGKYSFRDDLNHHCRSKWEANYCRFLLWIKKEYKYEPKTFIIKLPNGVKATYTPDLLVDNKEWHEIKGWKDRSKIRKWELFQQQYPAQKLVLIDKNNYKKIEKQHNFIIPNWEF